MQESERKLLMEDERSVILHTKRARDEYKYMMIFKDYCVMLLQSKYYFGGLVLVGGGVDLGNREFYVVSFVIPNLCKYTKCYTPE